MMKKSRKVFKAMICGKPSDSDSDSDTESFLHDEIEFNDKDNQLSSDDELIQHSDDLSEEEEVLPITDDEKDESDEDNSEKEESDGDDSKKEESDEEDSEKDEEHDLPNREAWGKKKSAYYSADFVDEDRGRTYREADAEAARAEAEEAVAIQKNFSSSIKNKLGVDLFQKYVEDSSEEEEMVDITSANKQEKEKYLKTQTHLLAYMKEQEISVSEQKKFTTLKRLVEVKKIRSRNLELYIDAKNRILSLYSLNLALYMMLIRSGENPNYHPVVQLISSCKVILDELKPLDKIAAKIVNKVLEKERQGEELEICSELEMERGLKDVESLTKSMFNDSNKTEKEETKVKRTKRKQMETENERQVLALTKEVKEEVKKRKSEDLDQDEEEIHDNENEPDAELENNDDEKRIITYQIAKNKGLVPHRKKEYRNPRVRHRMKYRKANIRRKGQVRGVVKEIKRYTGEPTGININVIKSRKFK